MSIFMFKMKLVLLHSISSRTTANSNLKFQFAFIDCKFLTVLKAGIR